MSTPESIRERLRSYLGDERYRRFVSRVPDSTDGTRLTYWQERDWEKFVLQHPECNLDFEEIVSVFGNCPKFGAVVRRKSYHERVATWIEGRPLSLDDLEKETGSTQSMKTQLQPGDQLYRFRSPPGTWVNMAGRAGIAVVRDGHVIDLLITSLN